MYNMYTYQGLNSELQRDEGTWNYDEHDEVGKNWIRAFEDKIAGARISEEEKNSLRNELDRHIAISTEIGDKKRGKHQEQWAVDQEARDKKVQMNKYKRSWKARNPLWKVTHRKLNPKNMELERMTAEEIITSEEMNRVVK